MMLAIFETAVEAQEETSLLQAQCAAGMIEIYSLAVITKDTYGSVTVRQAGDHGRVGAMLGMGLGSLIGLPGGLLGAAIGALAVALVGWLIDLQIVGVERAMVDRVAGYLLPGQSALMVEIDDLSFHALQPDVA